MTIVGLCAVLLAACSSTPGASSAPGSTIRPGTGVVGLKHGPALSPAEESHLVATGCAALPRVGASVARAATAFHGHGGSIGQILLQGPWERAIAIGGIEGRPEYSAIAADARTLDRTTIDSIRTDRIQPTTGVLDRMRAECSALHLIITG